MKGFSFSLAAAAAALVLGCQSPDMNNPVAINDVVSRGTTAKPSPTQNPTVIGFDQRITYTEPGVTSEVVRASGNAAYRITKVSPSDDNLYDVQIVVNGEISRAYSDLTSPTPAPWTFGDSSKDRIRIPQGGKVVLAKTFVVAGPGVPTILNMPVTVSEKELEVGSMSLIKADLSSSDVR